MTAVLMMILVVLGCIAALSGAFALGVFWAARRQTPPTARALTEEQQRAVDRARRELENFFAYDGTEQRRQP